MSITTNNYLKLRKMNPIIISSSELQKMPKSLISKIKSFQSDGNSCKELKARIKNLSFNDVDHRTDIKELDLTNNSEFLLRFDRWEKTNGEQWGNCAGKKITLNIGRKYARLEIESYRTNSNGSHWNESISLDQVNKIVKLLELSEVQGNEVDKEKYIRLASQEVIEAIYPDYFN